MAERLKNYPLAEQDILRTVEYFAAYTVFMGLRFLPKELDFPRYFLMFGGGWRNPLIYRDFISLLTGRGLLLPEHIAAAENIRKRFRGEKFFAAMLDDYGISGQYTEARIMADMARCFLEGKSLPRRKLPAAAKVQCAGFSANRARIPGGADGALPFHGRQKAGKKL